MKILEEAEEEILAYMAFPVSIGTDTLHQSS